MVKSVLIGKTKLTLLSFILWGLTVVREKKIKK